MRTPPSIKYSGLTIILDAPSRFDTEHLLSSPAGPWIEEITSLPTSSMDLRTYDCNDNFLPETKWIAIAGNKGANQYLRTSNDPPGYPHDFLNAKVTTIFDPQDCCDFKSMLGDDNEAEERFTERDSKERIPTRRKNYRFWTAWHLRKLLSSATVSEPAINPICYPSIAAVERILLATRGEDVYLDIETSRVHQCLTVIGFSTSSIWPQIYVVPVYLLNGDLAYPRSLFARFWRALSIAMVNNEMVIHNASFDLLVLAAWYGFPLPSIQGGSVYDTMVANHRCFPEIEKSLAHVISQWTNQPYHKDTSTEIYNREQENKLWIYNAHDVYTLKLIKDAQLKWASSVAGLSDSIAQANKSIIPYIANSLTGLPLDLEALTNTGNDLATQKEACQRIASILVGHPFNPGSSQQCAKFFHDTLNYPVTRRTDKGAPAMDSKALYQLLLKYDNPLLPVIIKYRSAAKALSMLESELL